MPRNQTAEEVRVHAARQVVSRWNRAKRARGVGKARRLVDPRRLRGPLPEPRHAGHRIVKPPRRPEPDGRIVTGEWSQLAAVGGLVQGEEHEGEPGIVAVGVQEGSQIARELGRYRDVATLVGTEPVEHYAVVVPQRAGV